jgi:serine/threonine protein phosphatase PrpC
VQHMVDAGFIKPEEARHHPRKNQLLAAMGSEDMPAVHVSEPHSLREGDAFLLCSDGWWDQLEPEDMERTLAQAPNPTAWLDSMAALVGQRQVPNQDNYTAVAVWAGDPAEVTRIGP